MSALNESRVGSYLRYAIGEIILVVLGILIAVSINNWNEDRKAQKQLQDILTVIAADLKSDIAEIDEILGIYDTAEKEFYTPFFNRELTRKDYMGTPRLAYRILGFREFILDERGYQMLLNSRHTIDSDKTDTLNDIIEFYRGQGLAIELDRELLEANFMDNFDHWKNNYHWWGSYVRERETPNPEFIEYALNDPDYRNRVSTAHFIMYDVYLPELEEFKEMANELLPLLEQ